MKASTALIYLILFVILIGGGVMGFNILVDPQCYYNCSTVDINRRTTNSYYRIAQEIKKNPEAGLFVVGSSRGGTTSPQWLAEVSGKKVLNVSAAGSEIFARSAFLQMALQESKVDTVLWYADYFEILSGLGDEKITKSPALYKFIYPEAVAHFNLTDLKTLIDRNTLEASFHALRSKSKLPIQDGSDIDYQACGKEDYPGGVSDLQLKREVDLLYESYTRGIFPHHQRPESWDLFLQTLKKLESKGVRTVIIIPPYHPDFRQRLKTEHPDVWQRHLEWIAKLQDLKITNLQVVNYFEGFPTETATAKHWDDGVHFNCHSAMKMTEEYFR